MKSKLEVFEKDAAVHNGYIYTTNDQLSSRLATTKMGDLVLQAATLQGKRVLDVGCGDAFFTRRYHDEGKPASLVAADPLPKAVAVAAANKGDRQIQFCVADGHALPWRDDSFDLVLLQAMLHHDSDPVATIKEALRIAPEIVILEPNGNNLGLKVIEKVSRYHREHHERSYSTLRIQKWVSQCGGKVLVRRFGGFVVMFSPAWLARIMKAVEPAVERMPVFNALMASQIVLLARRGG